MDCSLLKGLIQVKVAGACRALDIGAADKTVAV